MRTAKKEVIINADIFNVFQGLLEELIAKNTGDTQNFLQELKLHLTNFDRSVEPIISWVKTLEKEKKPNFLIIGVAYFFISKIFSKRKDFTLGLNMLEKAEKFLDQHDKTLSRLLAKETYLLKMAYHYSDN